ncbi:MAG: hypothetical protein INR72_15085 [Williamsia herbipolensis]|nr:hypothetical protein [Williamsia herbipolensis]
MPHFERQNRPLPTVVRTDGDVAELVGALLGGPIRRQTWLLLLPADGVPVQLVVPIEDLPYEPDDHVDDLGRFIADVMPTVDATQVVVVWERPAATTLYPVDWSWIDAVACTFAEHEVAVRAQVLLHDAGADVIDLRDDELALA